MDRLKQDRISELLRQLPARQEKVIRLYCGLGCQRPHSIDEMAQEFGVSHRVIADILGAAERKLAVEGVTANQLRQAAESERAAEDRQRSKASGARPCRSRRPDPQADRVNAPKGA